MERWNREVFRRIKIKVGKNGNKKFTTLYLNIGKKHGVDARALIGMINDVTDSNTIPIGKIEISRRHTLFDVGTSDKNKVLQAFKGIAKEAPDLEVKEWNGKFEDENKTKPKKRNSRRGNKKRKPTVKDRHKSSKRKSKSTRRERRRGKKS